MVKRVAVVGAGPSGLATVKELLALGHKPVCFERADSLGGVFRYDEDDGVVWQSCRLTSSGLLTAFSDFPVSPERAEHMPTAEYVRYLSEYADTFGVTPCLRFNTEVVSLRSVPAGGWELTTRCGSVTHTGHFDAVAVCSGLHQHPHTPEFPGQDSYPGKILHASAYRGIEQVAGKKVLVVGAGESGADIAAEVAEHAAETVLSLRRGVAVVSRRAFGKPRDYLTSRLMNGASDWLFQTRNPADNHKRTVYRYAFLPFVVLDKCLQVLYRQVWENLPMFFPLKAKKIRTNLQARKLTMQLLEESGGTVNEQFGTKDDCFVRSLAQGKCRRVAAIQQFEGQSVYFSDGSRFEPDLVLMCTGFETRMSFLDDETASAPRFLNSFNPQAGKSLGFVGFLRPAFGAIPPLAELQARWFALLQSDEVKLPDLEEMKLSIANWRERKQHMFRAGAERLEHLVDHTVFCDELATQIGCKPNMQDLKQQSRRFRKRFFYGPFVAAQYRLVGPGAKPELARELIEALPVVHPWPDRFNLLMRWYLCKILHHFLGPEYAPKLMIAKG